jgi:stage II sporulation protein D
MRPRFRIKFFALLISLTLFCASLISLSAQDTPQTRPRRVGTPTTQPTPDAPDLDPTFAPDPDAPLITGEPTVRIGLLTDARTVNISTTAHLLSATDADAPPLPPEVARVRIEPRHLPPPADAASASPQAPAVAPASGARPDDPNRTRTRNTIDERQAAEARTQNPGDVQRPATSGGVRLATRVVAPTRGAVVYASGTTPLFDARAPLVFASADEAAHPVKLNEKPYRGRLEVFANSRGTLTVVNVVGLEDYVRGVVANELSPGGYPALEALKAQAVAARTYAVNHRGQFATEGFDLLPTTRSQVYGGRSTEHPLTDRAVAETRGQVATYGGRPINALYTSTCGGRTEDAMNVFGGEAVPYLRARECAIEGRDAFEPFIVRTSREAPPIRDAGHASSARDVALLATHNFPPPARLSDEWLSAPASPEEVRALLTHVSTLARQPAPAVAPDAVRPAAFSSALARALDGESRGDVLLNRADIEYLLAFRDASEIPEANRADVAQLLRDGHLTLFPDATLRPRQPMSRARLLRTVAHVLEARGLFRLQKASARPAAGGALVLRPSGRGADRTLNVSPNAYLFRAFGDALYQTRELTLVGGEAVTFHTGERGEVDYLEARPAAGGAASDHFSPYTNWTVELTPAEVAARLGRAAGRTGPLVDLRVRLRGASRRALDLEVVGANATAHVTGGRIRSALGLREQLFVIERRFDEAGRVTSFVFKGRGWGHGVGMCQVGAYGLARSGLPYDRILKSYYTGISLTKLY